MRLTQIGGRQLFRAVAVLALTGAFLWTASPRASHVLPQPVPEVAEGFAITPLTAAPAPTGLGFGPGDADGLDLYATTLTGDVLRIQLLWTPAGPIATGVSTRASGFSQPLGLAFDDQGNLYVSDSHAGTESGRTDGRITRLGPFQATRGEGVAIVDGLPNGRHNTNHLRFRASDGRLYLANGNPNDNGVAGGDADVFPYSGAVLSVDVDLVSTSPALLHWKDAGGDAIPEDQIAGHPLNADFASKVSVLAFGFRNIFGIAFSPDDIGYTAMNGADDPSSQDALFRITPGTDYGFPFCYDEGPPGGTGADLEVVNNPLFPAAACGSVPPATALLGWHTCATGLDLPTDGSSTFPEEFRSSVYVGECATFFAEDWVNKNVEQLQEEDPADKLRVTHNTSHKVVRVELDEDGNGIAVNDFVTGLALATDVLFGPDGAMYVADIEAIYRVAPIVPQAEAPEPPAPPVSPAVPIQATLFNFVPAALVIPVGTTVEWQSTVLAPHTVTTADSLEGALAGMGNDATNSDANPDTFNSGNLPLGATFPHTFTQPGTYWYFCVQHHGMGMVGTITVVAAG